MTEKTHSHAFLNDTDKLPPIPFRNESYTTWLYLGLAIATLCISVVGFWIAGSP